MCAVTILPWGTGLRASAAIGTSKWIRACPTLVEAEYRLSPHVQSTQDAECGTAVVLSAVVAIPVRNERDRIADCLGALLNQSGVMPGTFGILLFLNNCTDDTREIVEGIAATALSPIRVLDVQSEKPSAGWARRNAMAAAAEWLQTEGRADGVLLTTDADSRVAGDWLASNLAAVASGADAVAGRIVLDPDDAAKLPEALHARGRLEAEYEQLLTEIGAKLDPEPGNPWPCHWQKSGATIAVRLDAFNKVGGMPDLSLGEDRAFIDAVRAHDLVVRHACDIVVSTSGRLDGRATGGVADTMKLRCEVPDSFCDERLENLGRAVRRVIWRRWLRRLYVSGRLARTTLWAPLLSITRNDALAIAGMPHCGAALAAIEGASPRLAFRPLRPGELLPQIRRAKLLLSLIRLGERRPRAARRADTPLSAAGPSPLHGQPST